MIAALLSGGRLHLQDGPIDLICRAWGDPAEVRAAYRQAAEAFPAVLPALCHRLSELRSPVSARLKPGDDEADQSVAGRMIAACRPFAAGFITPMAAVAGAVADHVLAVMTEGRTLERAFVNNGGDIAFHVAPGHALRCGLVAELATPTLDGLFTFTASNPARGIATSGRACKGRGGRSFSFGIADAVTILARIAAQADAAATVVANAVDLPGHRAIERRKASDIDPESDLGDRRITWDVGALTRNEVARALDGGRRVADALCRDGLILGAVLVLDGRVITSQPPLSDAA